MDRPVRKRLCQGIVDKAVLVDEREAGEGGASQRDLKVIPAARAILDGELGRVGEGAPKELLESGGHVSDASSVASVPQVSDLVLDRPVLVRAVASAFFGVALLTFALPFMAVFADERGGAGTGVELAMGDPEYSGRYVHAAYRGQVENLLDAAHTPALIALIALGAGFLLSWLPWRIGPAIGTLAGLAGLVGLFGVFQATTSLFVPAATDRRFGFWLSCLAVTAAAAWSAVVCLKARWWLRPPPANSLPRDYFSSREQR